MHRLRIPGVYERAGGATKWWNHSQEFVPHELDFQFLISGPRRHKLVLIYTVNSGVGKLPRLVLTSVSLFSAFSCCRLASMFCLGECVRTKLFSPRRSTLHLYREIPIAVP
jgi:hypothetical protein